ncbi:MAG: hypothetical protein ACKVN9_01165 [Methylophilaceae bacterium]
MNSKPLSKLIFFLAFTLSIGLSAAPETSPSVRLPGIYHVWKEEGSTDEMPEISMEEIERCVGKDYKISQKYDGFKAESARLERESGEFEKIGKTITPEREAIESEAKALNARTTLMNDRTVDLDRQNAELATLTAKKKMDAETVKAVNAKINNYNSLAKAHNADLALLKERVSQFEEKQRAFNSKLLPLKERMDAFNVKAEEFKARKKEFDGLLLSYKDKCTGERSIVK